MSIITDEKEVASLREAGRRLAHVLKELEAHVAPGVSTKELDELAERLIRDGGDEPAFLGYKPSFAAKAYPASLCTSINDEVVHGIPSKDRILEEGDIIGLDLGLVHDGLIVDSAISVVAGKADPELEKLIAVTRESLAAGIKAARAGNTIGDIGAAIAGVVRPHHYGIPETLGGHGVGRAVHEDPIVLNNGTPGKGEKLTPGMVLALEPMVNEGTGDVELEEDGYTVSTADGSRSAHFEHTIRITEGDTEIITRVE